MLVAQRAVFLKRLQLRYLNSGPQATVLVYARHVAVPAVGLALQLARMAGPSTHRQAGELTTDEATKQCDTYNVLMFLLGLLFRGADGLLLCTNACADSCLGAGYSCHESAHVT